MAMPKVKMSDLGAVDGPVPEATYSMRVDKAEYVEVPKDKHANPYIRVWHVITGPDDRYMGRYVFANYPITGKGSYRLHELLRVTGHPSDFEFENENQLVNLEFCAAVMIEKGTNGYPDKNVIRKHLELFG
jgi:hypothetical protein